MGTNRVTWVPLLARDLRALGACREEVAVFARTFPTGATPDDVAAAVAAGLSVTWLVVALGLVAEYEQAYKQARASAQYEALASVWPVWEGDA